DARTHETVQVFPRPEGFDESLVPREVGHDAHLDLRVVGREQGYEVWSVGECRTDLAPHLGSDRNVLEVRIIRRDPPGTGSRLVVAGVDATVFCDALLEGLDYLPKLGSVSMLQQQVE